MRSMMIIAFSVLAAATAHAQVKGQANSQAAASKAPNSEVMVTTTNSVYRSLRRPAVTYSGVGVQAVKSRNPLQLINPFAPVSQGSAEANTVRDPASGRAEGLRLLTIAFW
jgi:hypothetical protein